MKTLNRSERKMVIEYYANQCAEEMPADDNWEARDYHMDSYWMDVLKALGQVWRSPLSGGWYALIENIVSANQFDRDPAGFLESWGYPDTEGYRESQHHYLNDIIGAGIDAISSRAH